MNRLRVFFGKKVFFLVFLLVLMNFWEIFPNLGGISLPDHAFHQDLRVYNSLFASYTPHDCIVVDGNNDLIIQAAAEGWLGDGTSTNPYIIDGYNFTSSSGVLIDIRNVDLHFQISRNLLVGTERVGESPLGGKYSGITFENVANALIIQNIFFLQQYGVYLHNSHDITIKSNNISNNCYGIYLYNSENNYISENTVQSCQVGIYISSCSHNDIKENIGFDSYVGIYLSSSENNSAWSNIIYNCSTCGIQVSKSSNNLIHNNTSQNNVQDGIYLWNSGYNILSTNNASYNHWSGISLVFSSNYNIITNNTIDSNKFTGIFFTNSEYNTINKNRVVENRNFGISFKSSNNNTIYWNDFIDNNPNGTSQANDVKSNNEYSFNYWNDWSNPDSNSDGIVDNPYYIDSSSNNTDDNPLVSSILYYSTLPKFPIETKTNGWLITILLISLMLTAVFKKYTRESV